ncbi:MAG: GDP-mannose 4,6-dehydratase, partial [Synergistaceae bacterium]|nr:GDP-mannose 4,6-dehydratase [Synergistaceae bacterium]
MKNFYKGKRVFVTGYTGFKGSWLCEILLNFGAEVCGYALEPDELSLFNILNLKNKCKNNFADIRDLKKLKQAVKDFEPEIILHLAAQPIVLASYEDPVYTYETNVMGTVNILEAARECKSLKSFVNITTDKVYENKEWPWGYREHENLCGFDPYSNSKSCSELVTYSYKHAFFKDESSP